MKKQAFNIIALAIISMLAYLNTFGNKFVWDDELFVINNTEIRELSNAPGFFMEGTQKLYRPLRTVLYSATYKFSGLNPVGYHFVGKSLNALTVCVLYALIVLLFNNHRAAFWGALLFAVHPVHTEKVAFITSSYDILGDFLWISAFTCYVAFRRGRGEWYLIGSFALFAFGLLSSETAAVTPLVIILYDLTLGREESEVTTIHASMLQRVKSVFLIWGAYFAILTGYLAVRFSVLGRLQREGEAALNPDFLGNFVTMSGVVTGYFKLFVIPWPLLPIRDVDDYLPPHSVIHVGIALGMAALIAAAIYFSKRRPELSFSMLWFFVVLSPNLNIVPTTMLMAERYVYMPSATLSFLVAILFIKAGEEHHKRLSAVCIVVAIVFLVITMVRNRDWRDETTLWIAAIMTNPSKSDTAASNMAILLSQQGRGAEAERLLEATLKTDGTKPLSSVKLGELYLDSKKLDKAEDVLNKIKVNPKVAYRASYDIAQLRIMQGRFEEAEQILEGILKDNQGGPRTNRTYGLALFEHKKPGWAGYLVRAYALSDEPEYLVTLAQCYVLSGKPESAVRTARIGIAANPESKELQRIIMDSMKQ